LSAGEARRVALAAQGFATARPAAGARLDLRQVRRAVAHAGVLQIDSVNVLVRSHELPVFARLGPYPREALTRLAYRERELFEYWGHMASLVPVRLRPLLQWRMDEERMAPWAIARDQPAFVDAVRAEIKARGPLTAAELPMGTRNQGPWWGWGEAKMAMEWLFWVGEISCVERRGNFERVYDLTERVLPAEILNLPVPSPADSHRELLRFSAERLGVGTARDLADFFRLKVTAARPRLAELVEEGALVPVRVEDWREPAFLAAGTAAPRRVRGQALLSPFDSLVWERSRVERLFGMHLRIEIYTPAPRRVHGYYVLPFLLGERLVARVDLKADRRAGHLLVPGAHAEPGSHPDEVAPALAAELSEMARWLGLTEVRVGTRGDLAEALQRVPGGGSAGA
jgi:uncharacterized protein YcaQ